MNLMDQCNHNLNTQEKLLIRITKSLKYGKQNSNVTTKLGLMDLTVKKLEFNN